MDDFFAKYEYIKPWLIRNSPDPEREILQSPKERHKLDMPIDCILCGCCYSSCPSVWGEDNYMGPAALLRPTDSRWTPGTRRARSGYPFGQRARRLSLPHHHELRGGLPEGAQPHRGHPVAEEGGGAAEVVRQSQVAAPSGDSRRSGHPSPGQSCGPELLPSAQLDIHPDEAPLVDYLANLDIQRPVEHRAGDGQGVELAVFGARVGGRWQLIQQAVVEAAPDEGAVQLFGVDTGDDRVVSFVDHLARQQRCWVPPHRK